VTDETRVERWLAGALSRVATPRSAVIVIASATIAVTIIAGLAMRVVDHENYRSFGAGLWWAAQTVTTVGYGDDVPVTVPGRLLAVLVMLVGVAFVTVITAAIASAFVERARAQHAGADDVVTAEILRDIADRLERIEARMSAHDGSRS
jgi:voltage-gated potassium channel